MTKKPKAILIISDTPEINEFIEVVLKELSYRLVFVLTGSEAKIKYSNETFAMVILDMDMRGFGALDFVISLRRKEDLKHVKHHIPVLVFGTDAGEYQREFRKFDNLKFLEKPFTGLDLKKKMLNFTGNADVISKNTAKIAENEYLITEGSESKELYWILSGSFVITKLNQDENNVVVGKCVTGELVGEMSFLDSETRSASVKATEDSEVLVIPYKKFIDVMDHQPRWFRSLMQTLSQRLRHANQMIARKAVNVDADAANDPHALREHENDPPEV